MEYLTASRVTGIVWELENPISKHAERRRAEVTANLLQPQRNDSILDVGCGDGYQMSYIVGRAQRIVGIDRSLGKLKEAKKKIRSMDFICASSEKLPFQQEIFSKVTCLELLEHLNNPVETLEEIERVIKNVGILIVSVPYRERIVFTRCIHCGKLTPLWGHLHSFDEQKIASILPTNFTILRQVCICNIIASYPIFSFLPTRVWKLVDDVSSLLPGIKPCWLISKIKKGKSGLRKDNKFWQQK